MNASSDLRDNAQTTEPGDTDADPHIATDQASQFRPVLFWDKDQWETAVSNAAGSQPADSTEAGYGQLFDGSTTELWINSVDYSGVAEGLPFCDTCDNVLTEWNYFDQICSDKDECKMQDTLYDAYVKKYAEIAAGAFMAVAEEASYRNDHMLHCSTDYFPQTNVRRNNIMPAGASIEWVDTGAAGFVGAAHNMDCVNRGPYNSDHGFKCECPPGSELNSAGTQCVDINECRLGQHTCGWLPCIDYCAWGSSDGTVPNARWYDASVSGYGGYNGDYNVCGFDVSMSMNGFDILAYQNTGGYGKEQTLEAPADAAGLDLAGNPTILDAAGAGVVGTMNFYRPGGGYTCQCPEGLRWNEVTRTCDDINECIGTFFSCSSII